MLTVRNLFLEEMFVPVTAETTGNSSLSTTTFRLLLLLMNDDDDDDGVDITGSLFTLISCGAKFSPEKCSKLQMLTLRVYVALVVSSGYDVDDVIQFFFLPKLLLTKAESSEDEDDASSIPESLISSSEAEIDATELESSLSANI